MAKMPAEKKILGKLAGVLIALLTALCFHPLAQAQTGSLPIGNSFWVGQLTVSPPPSGLSGTFSATMTMNSDGTNASMGISFTTPDGHGGNYFINSTGNGTVSGGSFNFGFTPVGIPYLPFGDIACALNGVSAASPNSISASGMLAGEGSCPTENYTLTLTNLTPVSLGASSIISPTTCGTVTNPGNQDTSCPLGPNFLGQPINAGTGNVFETMTDYTTAGPNKLQFTRYYNSISNGFTYASEMGYQWRHNYDRYLNVNPAFLTTYYLGPNNVAAERPDGKQIVFNQSGSTYTAPPSEDATLVPITGGFRLTLHDDTVETYSLVGTKGYLTQIKYRGGYTQNLTYNAGHQLLNVTDSYNRVLHFTYTLGRLTQVTTPDSLILTYGYDASGTHGAMLDRLASVGYNTTPTTSQTFQYTNATYPFALTSVTDENGTVYERWGYDTQGRGNFNQFGDGTTTTANTYNLVYNSDLTVTVTNPLAQVSTYTFLGLGNSPRLTKIVRTANSGVSAATYSFGYDPSSFLTSQTDWNNLTTTYTNDSHGDPTAIVESSNQPLSRTTTITYDPVCVHLPKTVVTENVTTGFTYNINCSPLTRKLTDTTSQSIPYPTNGQTRTWTYSWSNFLPLTIKTPLNFITHFTFTAGALTNVTNPLTQATNITSTTPGGLPLTVVDPNNVTTTLTYTTRNWLHTKTVMTAAGNLTTTYDYDNAGNLTKVTLPDNSYLVNGYDTAHRLTSITDSFNNSIQYTLDAEGNPTVSNIKDPSGTLTRGHTAVYDQLGRITKDITGTNWTTKYGYDSDGNLTSYNPPIYTAAYAIDKLNRPINENLYPYGLIQLAYDLHDRPLTAEDRDNHTTGYVYDGFGDVIQQASPDTGTTVYYYDSDGNLTKKVDGLSVEADYTYDQLDRVKSVSYPADATQNVTYTYDQTGTGFAFGIGRLTSLTDPAGSLTRSYDERGNLTGEQRVAPTGTFTTSYGYDAASRIASITYPSGAQLAYTRDAMGRITAAAMTPSGGSAQNLATGVTYKPFGPYAGFTYGNGISETAGYDLDYNFTSVIDTGTAGTLESLAYSYLGLAGQLKQVTDTLNSANNISFTLDSKGRMNVQGISPSGFTYFYDGNDNRTSIHAASGNTDYTYNPGTSQLATITFGGVTTTLATNALGNITGFTPGYGANAVTTLTYSKANRLASVANAGGTLASYTYDGFGNRILKAAGAATTTYQYAPDGTLLAEKTGSAETDYAYLNDRPLATLTGTAFTWLHADRFGTPQMGTNAAQGVLWSANYLIYGDPFHGTPGTNLRLPGQYYDAESGFHHNGFRDYVPQLGRYLEADPVGIQYWTGMNIYGYANALPMSYIDPLGLWQVTISLGWGYVGQISFGLNNGQWNAGAYGGYGAGVGFEYDKANTPCQKPGLETGIKANYDVGIHLPGFEVSTSINGEYNDKREAQLEGGVNIPPIGTTGGRIISFPNAQPIFQPFGKANLNVGQLYGLGANYFAIAGGKYIFGNENCTCPH